MTAAIRSNRPVDFVEKLGRAAGWSGDAKQIALAAAHRGLNFEIHEGEILGVVRLALSGQNDRTRLFPGLDRMTSGTAHLLGAGLPKNPS